MRNMLQFYVFELDSFIDQDPEALQNENQYQ
jgi:hypothetical protein